MLQQALRVFPYRHDFISNKVLVCGYFGGWTFLEHDEFFLLQSGAFSQSSELIQKLSDAGIIATPQNVESIIRMFNRINQSLFLRPSLHMFNTTSTCNYRCRYCHAGVSQGKEMMSIETARKALNFIFRVSGQYLAIEFQGGECLLNWKVVKYSIEKAREINKVFKRNLHICIVSNLSLMDEEKLEFLTKHEVSICTSLDGVEEVHDKHRLTAGGKPTFALTQEKIKFIQAYFSRIGSKRKVDILATITKDALKYPYEIVDIYVSMGIPNLHLRPVQNLGDATLKWDELTYTPEEFFAFWKESMDYILELNRRGTEIMERGAYNIVCKILARKDPMYVEQMNPTGMGRATLLYYVNGDIYNGDEGRMLDEPLFVVGNVDQNPWEVLSSQVNLSSWMTSMLDLCCYWSPYRAWGGLHPVHTYRNQGTIVPNISMNSLYKIYTLQCRYLFDKILNDPFAKQLFLKWSTKVVK